MAKIKFAKIDVDDAAAVAVKVDLNSVTKTPKKMHIYQLPLELIEQYGCGLTNRK